MLDSLDKVNAFVAASQAVEADVELTQGKYIVNAKSIMGVFSLDLTKPVTVRCEAPNAELEKQLELYKPEY